MATMGLTVCGMALTASPAAAADPDPPTALPQNATAADLKWQPDLDYDTDSCYNVPAIGPDGRISAGLEHANTSLSGGCRDTSDLDNTNAYSRQRCNSGWCVYLYDYYFEKDVATANIGSDAGHRHDWEHIAVWVKDDKAEYVSASQHGDYVVRTAEQVRWDGTHPKLVFHKDGGSTHNFRLATAADEPTENAYSPSWRRSALVSYNGFPGGLRDQLFSHDFGSASIAIKDDSFADNLEEAIPRRGCTSPGTTCYPHNLPWFAFDFNLDDGSPGDPSTPTPEPQPQRVMIVGDSISHGHQGDYTWRYRIWQYFRNSGLNLDLVGPYQGTQPAPDAMPPQPPRLVGAPPPSDAPQTNGGYAPEVESSAFDRDHFSVWGRQIVQDNSLIRGQVATYKPDLLLVELGFNDLGWFVSGPAGTVQSMETFVEQARLANPQVDFAIANIPQRTSLGSANPDLPAKTTDYNARLAGAIGGWERPGSRVRLVDIASTYKPDRDVYDGLHPNAYGEFKIARAFARTLADDFGVGSPAQIPVPPPYGTLDRHLATPTSVRAASTDYGVTVLWDKMPDAGHYEVQYRDVTDGGAWTSSAADANRYDTQWPVDGHTYAFQVRSTLGDTTPSEWSSQVTAIATPRKAGQPTDVRVTPGPGRADVSWTPPTGANADLVQAYVVWVLDKSIDGAWPGLLGYSASTTSVRVPDLTSGHTYEIGVQSWSSGGGSFLTPSGPFQVG
jgi:lysophospholipase L1-like esterase